MSFAPPSLTEIVRALYGVWLIFVRDTRAITLLDTSVRGFWASFFAAALALPANMLIFLMTPDPAIEIGLFSLIVIVEIYVVMVLAYPVAVSFLVKTLDREANFIDYVVAHNWANLPISYLYIVAVLVISAGTDVLPESVAALFTIATHGVILYLLWRVAKSTLDLSEVQAVAVVIFELVVSAILFRVLLFLPNW